VNIGDKIACLTLLIESGVYLKKILVFFLGMVIFIFIAAFSFDNKTQGNTDNKTEINIGKNAKTFVDWGFGR
jgi:hypothetical protein